MSNTQYAVCHLQRGSGNDSGMSCHIERKDAKGKKYGPIAPRRYSAASRQPGYAAKSARTRQRQYA